MSRMRRRVLIIDVPRDAAPPPDPDRLLTVTEAARLTGLSRSTISGWITRGSLPTDRGERLRRFRPADLLQAQTTNHAGTVVPVWRREPRRAGRRLRQLREAAGLSQLDLETASGLSHEAISLLETGHRTPQAASVHRLAQALGVAPEDFVAAEEPSAMLTTAEAAVRLGVPVSRLQTWLATGKLPGVKVSGQWRVAAGDVAALDGSERLRGRSRRLDPRYRG